MHSRSHGVSSPAAEECRDDTCKSLPRNAFRTMRGKDARTHATARSDGRSSGMDSPIARPGRKHRRARSRAPLLRASSRTQGTTGVAGSREMPRRSSRPSEAERVQHRSTTAPSARPVGVPWDERLDFHPRHPSQLEPTRMTNLSQSRKERKVPRTAPFSSLCVLGASARDVSLRDQSHLRNLRNLRTTPPTAHRVRSADATDSRRSSSAQYAAPAGEATFITVAG